MNWRFLALAVALIFSAASAQTLDLTAWVAGLYPTYLQRAGSPGEIAFYVNAMNGGQVTQANVVAFFVNSPEFQSLQVSKAFPGTQTDICNWCLIRNSNYSGGASGFVNSGLRVTDNVSSSASAFEWALLGIVNSAATAGENVGVYGQANGSSSGPVWDMVAQSVQTGTGNAIGIEVDVSKPAGSPGCAVGVDIVNVGNANAGLRCSPGMKCLVSPADSNTYIELTTSGGIKIVVHGATVENWP